jgi:hypothetical protein
MRPLKRPLKCHVKTSLYLLRKGVQVTAEWNEQLQWWDLAFDNNAGQIVKATTTETPEFL